MALDPALEPTSAAIIVTGNGGGRPDRRARDAADAQGLLMEFRPSLVERAYQLASSSECMTVSRVIERLGKEGYINARAHLQSREIRAALQKACTAARER